MNKNLPETYSFLLERTARIMKQYSAKVLREEGSDVTIEQWAILKKLQEAGDMSQVELADSTLKDKPTVTRILDLLETKNLVKRLKDPDDRRKFIITLTAEGKKLIKKVLPVVMEVRTKGWEGLGDKDFDELKRILSRVEQNFSD